MIRVRLFGLLRLDSGIKELELEARSVTELLSALEQRSGQLSAEALRGCVIFINGKPGSKKSRLSDGDEVMLLSPAAGG